MPSSSPWFEFAYSTFCNPLPGGDDDWEDEDDDHDYLDYCNSTKIVEATIRREVLLLKLQELVDAETPQQARAAICAMDSNSGNDEQLLRFLVRAGTFEILQKRLVVNRGDEESKASLEAATIDDDDAPVRDEMKDDDDRCPAPTTAASGPILSPLDAQPLLKKLSYHHEKRRLKRLEKKRRRTNWYGMVGIF